MVDRAERWLHGERETLRHWRRDHPPGGVEEILERALAGVDALAAGGGVGAEQAGTWRARLCADDGPRPDVATETSARAGALLDELLAGVPSDPEWDDERHERFAGALELLAAARAGRRRRWDERTRRHLGWPTLEEELAQTRSLNAGGTEVELLAVLPGPAERRAGYRVVLVLRFADGVNVLLDREEDDAPADEWPDWRLSDDAGTAYMPGGGGGGDGDQHVSFRSAPPPDARWLEVALEGHPEATFRVAL